MSECIIYHNPRCSKSREALDLLTRHGIEPVIIDYLKTPLNLAQLTQLSAQFDFKDFVRHNDPLFRELNLSLTDEPGILNAMLKAPILMQRPIVTYRNKTIIARPPEKVVLLIKATGDYSC